MQNAGAAAPALPVLMTVAEAAEYLHVTPGAVAQRIARGALPYTRLGGRVYILRDELAAEIERNRRAVGGRRQKETAR